LKGLTAHYKHIRDSTAIPNCGQRLSCHLHGVLKSPFAFSDLALHRSHGCRHDRRPEYGKHDYPLHSDQQLGNEQAAQEHEQNAHEKSLG
jgi:hypothetical protein